MTSYTLSPVWGAGAQLFDNSGNVLTGGKIETYQAGTTTPAATYTTPIGNIFNSNPIVADASGRLPNEIWLSINSSYKFVLKDSNDVLIATYDNIPSLPPPPLTNDASTISYEPGYTVTAGAFTVGLTYLITSVGTTDFVAIGASSNNTGIFFTATGSGSGTGQAKYSRTVESKLQETVSIKDFGAVGDGIADDTAAIQAALDSKLTAFFGISSPLMVYFPTGTYLVSSTIQVPNNVSVYGNGLGSTIRGNFVGAVMKIGVLAAPARGINMTANNLRLSCGVLCDQGFFFRGVVRSNFSNLYVISDNPCKATFAAFRFGGEVYSNSFQGLKGYVNGDPSAAPNGVGFHIGNDSNAWGTIFASTNDNYFTNCASTSYNVGFWLDSCAGIQIYASNAEKGASYAVKFSGGLYNNVYNFWSEQLKFYWNNSNKENGAGGFTVEASTYCGVYDTPLIGASFVMDTGFFPTFQNAFIGGESTIAAAVSNAVVRDVAFAGGFVPTTAIIDNGTASEIEYRDNGYPNYTRIYSTGLAGAQGFKYQGSGAFTILTNLFSNTNLTFQAFDGSISTNAVWRPSTDNTLTLGTAANRWSTVYAGTGAINTSDERQKQDVKDLSDAEHQAAIAIKGLIKSFKFKNAVVKKGDKARIHFGVMAQQVAEAFKIVGLNPDDYALFCYDKWDAVEEVVDDKGEIIVEAREAGDSYGVRYEELLAFVISAL